MSRQLLRIHGDVLIAGSPGGDRYEIGHPAGTAQFSAAWTDTADASRFLTGSDLFHLDTHTERLGQHLDQLAEVHALIRDVIENRLVAIALIFHVANLHIQSQVRRYLAGADHGGVFFRFRFLVFVDIDWSRFPVNPFRLVVGSHVVLFHLQENQLAGKRDGPDVMAGTCLYRHDVAFLQRDLGAIQVIAFSRILELDLYEIGCVDRVGHVAQPVVSV